MSALLRMAARWYQEGTAKELRKYGLLYQDILNEFHPDVQVALSRLSPEELSNRNKRLKRAADLSVKHSELSPEAQAKIDVWRKYLPLERAQEERLERASYKHIP
eukprot:CAMPEP_0173380508 /NCGR_PEP_ID=MMETSP1356-20130122/3187_1 /TAXON_ID=77927 ORGANISM="Hemiselmis virescens, Strain PCC157" /NCGR_SAMPLE_ID=MMETSP1356 /ASSEMBLY_ACC=CAM_ASM_000847 /LENGTH=104 /DNA_ID=CAMNT_0014334131 /DNA_START=35 /DNA_END=349 /DNA_ORIENTATION=+